MKTLFILVLLSIKVAAEVPALQPALLVHQWRPNQHVVGYLAATPGARFWKLAAEPSNEPEREGSWIEADKVADIRRLFPQIYALFAFGEMVTVGATEYVRVAPAPEVQRPSGKKVPRHVQVETWPMPLRHYPAAGRAEQDVASARFRSFAHGIETRPAVGLSRLGIVCLSAREHYTYRCS